MFTRLKNLFRKPLVVEQRQDNQKKCPPECYLPLESLTLYLPLCDANCNMDCTAMKHTMVHAHEWEHEGAAKEAYKLLKEHLCLKAINPPNKQQELR
jgi:hypothetical protein